MSTVMSRETPKEDRPWKGESKTTKDNRVANHHHKLMAEMTQRTLLTKRNTKIPTYRFEGTNKRVPTTVASALDKDAGKLLLQKFKDLLPTPQVCGWTYDERREKLTKIALDFIESGVGNMTKDEFLWRSEAAEVHLMSYEKHYPNKQALPASKLNDFVETLSNNPSGHRRLMKVPPGSDLSKYPAIFHRKTKHNGGSGFVEMPLFSTQTDLKFSGHVDFVPFVTTMPQPILDRAHGQIIFTSDGHISDVRLEESLELNLAEQAELLALEKLATRCKDHLKREPSVLNICQHFFAFGSKRHRDTTQSSTYTFKGQARDLGPKGGKSKKVPQNNKLYSNAIQCYERMRKFAKETIIPRLKEVFFLEIMVCELFFQSQGVDCWTDNFSSATMGTMFWLKSHVDMDLWWSGLVCIDNITGGIVGGDWGSASSGHVLKSYSGSLYIYGPWNYHCTTLMNVVQEKKGLNPKRFYTAFYGKEEVLYGIGTSVATAKRMKKK